MSEVIKAIYPSGNKLDAAVYAPDGQSIWNIVNESWDSVASLSDNWGEYTFALEDSGNTGMYIGEIPESLPANNPGEKYTFVISLRANSSTPDKEDLELGGKDIYWNGSALDSEVTITVTSFSSVESGDAFFSKLLFKQEWSDATSDQKQAALNQATLSIKRLPFRNFVDLNSPSEDIIIAQYYEAFELLSGVNLESELKNLRATSRGLASVRSTYDSTLIPDHLRAGLVSAVAWSYLSPYIDTVSEKGIRLSRVS